MRTKEDILKEFYKEISLNGCPNRLGKVFKTKKKYYFLDTGTGKVACLKKNVYKLLKSLLESDCDEDLVQLALNQTDIEDAIQEIRYAIKEEHILSAPRLVTLTGTAVTSLEDTLKSGVENVTLEVTEKCNLRCKYCIYNPSHAEYREFGHRDMQWETAKKAIDFLKSHSDGAEHPHIGFYGGEPLINFNIIKKSVEYAKENFKDITFAMTTNATLVNEDIADYLLENEVNIIVSLDGPKDLHDANRILVNGCGSYENTVRGIRLLLDAQRRKGKKGKISFNMVVSGPNYDENYTKIQEFLDKEEWISKDIMVLTATVDRGPKDSEYYIPQGSKERQYTEGTYDPLCEWEVNYKKSNNDKKVLFSDGVMDKGMMIIHKRLLSEYPVKAYGLNGCCVPGQRRIYVTVDGDFLLCEKVGNIPNIGNVNKGFDIDRIRSLYVEEFINNAKEYCKNCWAVNLCSMCYVNCYDKEGPHFEYRHESCRSERLYLENNLIRYHTILEENPDVLLEYNQKDFH